MTKRPIPFLFAAFVVTYANVASVYAQTDEELDARIRAFSESLIREVLQEKNDKILTLEAKIKVLEQQLAALKQEQGQNQVQGQNQGQAQSQQTIDTNDAIATADALDTAPAFTAPTAPTAVITPPENELGLAGFYDFAALSKNVNQRHFEFGGLELGLEYVYSDHLAANAALVWDGDTADVGVAVIDYYWFDDNIPTRGRIFNDPGFHIQLGRFDLPFGIDYQYFASPDRIAYSAPLTTERIQQGGFGGDGLRSYGSWGDVNYAVFWTNSVFEDDGDSIGGRLGLVFGRTPFLLHSQSNSRLEIGASALLDSDGDGSRRNEVFALDFNAEYEQWQLKGEVMWRNEFTGYVDDFDNLFAPRDESAYYIMIAKEFTAWSDMPLTSYVRFDRWLPDYQFNGDDDGMIYRVNPIKRLSMGVSMQMHDNVVVKFDYFDTLGSHTDEPDFLTNLGALQLVVLY